MDQEKLKKKARERLAELQKSGLKAAEGATPPGGSLHYDLLLLLRNDPEIRATMFALLKLADDTADAAIGLFHGDAKASADDTSANDFATIPEEVADPLGANDVAPAAEYPAFARQARLLQLIEADPILRDDWLLDFDSEVDAKLTRLIAFSAQWDALLQLWERLANRCKQEQRSLNSDEHEILKLSLANHNLLWRGKQAELADTASDIDFDHKRHERGNAQGNRVIAQWQPGLLNAGKILIKKPLVKTE